jgi:uncharacterized protein YlaI
MVAKIKRRKVKCVICEKEFEAWTERVVRSKSYIKETKSVNLDHPCSNDGILFYYKSNIKRWFCNECWEEIIIKLKIDTRI